MLCASWLLFKLGCGIARLWAITSHLERKNHGRIFGLFKTLSAWLNDSLAGPAKPC